MGWIFKEEHLDLFMVPLGFSIMCIYHLYLLYRYLASPDLTSIGYENHNKKAWVEKMLLVEPKDRGFAISVLNGLLSGSTSLCSISLVLCSLIGALLGNSSNNFLTSRFIFGDSSQSTSSIKYIAILAFFLLAFACFACRWSKIASHLPGRTDNEIKNVWNTYLKKRSLQRLRMANINTTDDTPNSSSSNISNSDQNIHNEEPTNQEVSSSHDQQLTAVAEYPKVIEVAAIGPISVDDKIQKPLSPSTSTLSNIINSTQQYKDCSNCYDINPTCYNDKIINNVDMKLPDNLVSYSEDELWNMVESPRRPINLDHDHHDVNYESWKSGHEKMEAVEYWVRLLEDELGLDHEKDSIANITTATTSQQSDQNNYQTMSKMDHNEEPEIWCKISDQISPLWPTFPHSFDLY